MIAALVALGSVVVWTAVLGWLEGWSLRRLAPAGGPEAVGCPPRDLGRLWRSPARTRAADWVGLAAVLLALAPVPISARWIAADLDAGLLWLLAAGALGLVAAVLRDPAAATDRLAVLVGSGVILGVTLVPVVLYTASLNLADVVIAQQGGLGNWFLWRDPFLLVCAGGYVAAAAFLVPAARPAAGPLGVLVLSAWTLVTGAVGACVFLGGWWAFVPFLDPVPALAHLGGKILLIVGAQLWLRARLPRRPDGTLAEPPVRLLLVAVATGVAGSAAWMVISGAAL